MGSLPNPIAAGILALPGDLLIAGAINQADYDEGEALLLRIVAMLTKLAQRGGSVREESSHYFAGGIDHDHDHDHDQDEVGPGRGGTRSTSGACTPSFIGEQRLTCTRKRN